MQAIQTTHHSQHFCSHEVHVNLSDGSSSIVALASTEHAAIDALMIWAGSLGRGRFQRDEHGMPLHQIITVKIDEKTHLRFS